MRLDVGDTEVFSTGDMVIYQCDYREQFAFVWGHEKLHLRWNELLAFKRKIYAIDLAPLFDVGYSGIEVVYFSKVDRHLIFALEDILKLRDLLTGAFAILQLNSQIHRVLYNPFAGSLTS